MHWINWYYYSVWNGRSTKIEVSNSLLHAKFEGNKLPVGFYVTDTHDFNKTDKVTFQQSYIKTFISLLQFSTPPHGFLSCMGDKNAMWQPRIMLIMKQQHKEELTSTRRYVCRHMHEKVLPADLSKRAPSALLHFLLELFESAVTSPRCPHTEQHRGRDGWMEKWKMLKNI